MKSEYMASIEVGHTIPSVLHKDRDCDSFRKWQLGFTLKEHKEMIDKEWEQKREDERDWQTRQGWQLAIVAGIFTIIGGAIAWLLSRGGH